MQSVTYLDLFVRILFSNDLPTDGETLRNALDGIIQLVRFPTMDAEEFARGPGNESVLTSDVSNVKTTRTFSFRSFKGPLFIRN